MRAYLYTIIFLSVLISCQNKETADLIIINASVQSVDSTFQEYQAVAVKDGNILALGTSEEIKELAEEDKTKIIDAEGQFVMPGFIEGHGHFIGLGRAQQNINLLHTSSWQEVVDQVAEKAKDANPGEWIVGRGWHQEKWNEVPGLTVQGYPYHHAISAVSQKNPVVLYHASGHGLMANQLAMNAASISNETMEIQGGEIVRDADGEPIGVFEENAMQPIRDAFSKYQKSIDPSELRQKWNEAVDLAVESCLQNGITSFQDAGLPMRDIKRLTEMAEEGQLPIRLWSMVRQTSDKIRDSLSTLRVIDAGDRHFTCRAIKTDLDGALGSYGAWLLEPYNDKENFSGQNTTSIEEVEALAELAIQQDMQLCVHAIGDRANREFLDIAESFDLAGKDARWRSEHAQHINPVDIPRFAELDVIASMQAIHCTSDSPFVVQRLGVERAKNGAYVWKSLLEAGAVVTNGTDAPVEEVNPLASYYAMVTRKRNPSAEPFFEEECLSREQALHSYTLANAYAAFEEEWKGSLEVGKVADIVILDKNLLTCSNEDILNAEVKYTIVNGEIVYQL